MAVVIAGSLALVGCAGQEQSGTPSARVSTWVSGAAGGAAIGTLEADSANIDQALAHHDAPAAIKTVCALLTNDAETAIGNLPTPDGRLTNDLNDAYQKGAAAGDDCYDGAVGKRQPPEAVGRRASRPPASADDGPRSDRIGDGPHAVDVHDTTGRILQ